MNDYLSSILSSVINLKTCFSDLEIFCVINVYWDVFLKNNYIENNCIPQCPLECTKTEFKTSIASNQLNGDLLVDILKNKSNMYINNPKKKY